MANIITGQTNDLSFFVVAAPILGELVYWGLVRDPFPAETLVFDEPTEVGFDVQVDFGNGVTVTFQEVSSSGVTTQILSPSGPTLPSGFQIATDPPVYYDISTTAAFTGAITVTINYDEAQLGGVVEQDLKGSELERHQHRLN